VFQERSVCCSPAGVLLQNHSAANQEPLAKDRCCAVNKEKEKPRRSGVKGFLRGGNDTLERTDDPSICVPYCRFLRLFHSWDSLLS
jgi:hypothetical protein